MGNLIKETPYSEITATLEVLDRLGIRRKNLSRLRSEADYAKQSGRVHASRRHWRFD